MIQYDLVLSQNIAGAGVQFAERLVTMSKGCLISADTDNVPGALAVGTNGQVLVADSTQALGIKWASLDDTAKLSLVYSNVEIVVANGTAADNFTRLKAAYDAAKTKTPNGAALSANNRYAIIAMPGVYSGVGMAANTQFVDLFSFDGEKSVIFNGPITISASDVRFSGIKATSLDIATNLPALVMNKCEGINSYGAVLSGTFIDCVGIATSGTLSGNFIRCAGSVSGLTGLGDGSALTGTFMDCTLKLPSSIGATAKLYNCRLQATAGSFPTPAAGGMLYGCVNGDGTMVNTAAGSTGKELVNYTQLALKYDAANISNDIVGDAASTIKSPSVKAIKDYADALLASADAMVFKGTVGVGGTYTIAAFNALTVYNCGWTFKIITAGTVKGRQVEVGDLIMSTVDRLSGGVDADWVVGQTNIDGAVTGPASAGDGKVAIFDGTSGKVIKDSGITLGSMASKTDTDYILKAIFDDNNTAIIAINAGEPQSIGFNNNSFLGRGSGNLGTIMAYEAQSILSTALAVPASKTAAGTKGQWAFDNNYFYQCLVTGTAGNALWGRIPMASEWT